MFGRILTLSLLTGLLVSGGWALDKSGTITSNETWSSSGPADTIRIMGDVTIPNNVTVTIMPGTVIKGFDNSGNGYRRWITITGGSVIRAIGTQAAPISFNNTCLRFELLTRDSLNIVQYCNFRNGWGYALIEFRNPTEPSETSAPLIDHCNFSDGSYCCIYITSGGSPTITNCSFKTASSGIFLHGGKDVVIRNCHISDVSCGIINASIPEFRQTLTVDHVTIYNVNGTRSYNWANGFGVMCANDSGNLVMTNSIIDGTPSHAIRNNADDSYYPNQPYGWSVTADYNCFYNIGGENVYLATAGDHDLESDPLLNNPDAQDFSLKAGSPCLGTASDGLDRGYMPGGVAGREDRRNVPAAVPGPLSRLVGPHPVSDRAVFDATRLGRGPLYIRDLKGRLVRELTAVPGQDRLVWDGKDRHGQPAEPGLYFYTAGSLPGRFALVKVR